MTGDGNNTNARLARLEARAEATDHKLDDHGRILADINTKLDRRTETSWPVVISSVALAATIGTLALAPVNKELDRFQSSQRRQWDEMRRVEQDGHPPTQVRLHALEKAVDRTRQELKEEIADVDGDSKQRDELVDVTVQREMRILDQAMQNRFDKEDERLQREMDLKDESVQKSSQLRHEKVVARLDAVVERVTKIEKEQGRRTGRVYSNGGLSK